MRTAKTSLSTAAVVGALVASGLMAAPAANATPRRHNVARTTPTWVGKAHSLGKVSSKKTTSVRVYLTPNGGTDALAAAVASVSTPGSASYRHFISSKKYHARYDATSATVSAVSKYLKGEGVKVTSVEAHHRYLAAKGTNAAIQEALGVSLRKFKHRGQVVQANTDPVTLPTGIAGSVLTVTGLDTTPRKVTHTATRPAGYRNARPCSRYYGQVAAKYEADNKTPLPKFQGKRIPYSVCGYTGPQFRAAYEGATKLTGSGVTVAVIDAFGSPDIAKDANTYATRNGDGAYATGQLTQVLPDKFKHKGTGPNGCGANGWWGEETLDVEAVHAMASDSDIRYYGAVSCYDDDIFDTQTSVVDEDAADIVTNSYGEPEEYVGADAAAAEQVLFEQAALQGMSFLFSSGDNGDEVANTGLRQADASATDPYVTAVGGTADAIGSAGTHLFQTGWGTEKYSLSDDASSWTPAGYLYGAGGGESALWNQPDYQQGVVPGQFSNGRAVPDIAMDADPTTGMLVGQTQKFSDGTYYAEYRIGGTSLASPLMAGMAALAAQNAGSRLGFLNPTIYQQAGTSVITDIKGKPKDAGNVRADYANGENSSDGMLYSVRTFNQDSSLAVTKGWDEVTGVGSPNASWLTSLAKPVS